MATGLPQRLFHAVDVPCRAAVADSREGRPEARAEAGEAAQVAGGASGDVSRELAHASIQTRV
jgi:hypothetical protein